MRAQVFYQFLLAGEQLAFFKAKSKLLGLWKI